MNCSCIRKTVAGSGFLSHVLANRYRPVGPFRGAVVWILAALVVAVLWWAENCGTIIVSPDKSHAPQQQTLQVHYQPPMVTDEDKNNNNKGQIHKFVFLWSLILVNWHPRDTRQNEQCAFQLGAWINSALIFMDLMGSCALGLLFAPSLRQVVTALLTPLAKNEETDIFIATTITIRLTPRG
ncbi:hypothetical protein ACA910_009519 [Epithemia clementina (nom. ined.)]